MIIHFSQIMICLQLLVYCIGGISLLDNEIDCLLKKKLHYFSFKLLWRIPGADIHQSQGRVSPQSSA